MRVKISIIVPIYNTEKYLIRCIESIIKQTLNEIEIILINDGSTDRSLNIIKKYEQQDKRIIVVDKINNGVSSARNEGLEIVKGKYILNVDSDDWIEKNYCEDMYIKAEKFNLDIVISDFYENWDNGIKKYNKQLLIKDEEIITPNFYLESLFDGKSNMYLWNKLIKTEIYKNNNIIYDEDISYSEDAIVLCKAIVNSQRIGKINKSYYHYIKRQTSINKNMTLKQYMDIIEAYSRIENLLKQKKINISVKLRLLNNLSAILNIDIKEKKFEKVIEYYINLFKNKEVIQSKLTIKMRIFLFIFIIFPDKKNFYIVSIINKIGIKIKNNYRLIRTIRFIKS